ncbi:hypothetical protein [Kineothrix sp. MB12-C1]|uniref:hypothetical protein n=1 Tax=Kineothrix sp. MB12-C1 TaxID=3070215 RepID=UPI0027D30F0C|nr:hypothetical protein [Kineothrix sp. MB12-C1]WMC92308.1 hypothetical protein RBB56_15890 [Kineothrix sp. MB12-C1]
MGCLQDRVCATGRIQRRLYRRWSYCGRLTRYKNIGVNENGTNYYGHVSEFDLTRLPNYQSLKLGENLIVEISMLNSSQILSYNTWISKEDQFNINEFNYNSVKITDFNGIRDIEVWMPSGTEYQWRDTFARYVPSTGKLYIILGSTAKAYRIALYRI